MSRERERGRESGGNEGDGQLEVEESKRGNASKGA